MKKLYSTHLFNYQTPPTTPFLANPQWKVNINYGYATVTLHERYYINLENSSPDQLYSMRNQALKQYSKTSFLEKVSNEINLRKAVHPLLKKATLEQINELETRTVKNAVTAKLKNEKEQRYYQYLLKDINLWRNIYGT